jgi:hypothetical protein
MLAELVLDSPYVQEALARPKRAGRIPADRLVSSVTD